MAARDEALSDLCRPFPKDEEQRLRVSGGARWAEQQVVFGLARRRKERGRTAGLGAEIVPGQDDKDRSILCLST